MWVADMDLPPRFLYSGITESNRNIGVFGYLVIHGTAESNC
jgi:bifunctional pyridoxal-dependent enzyme with beta-cystathionase and maltose regulon repressor activities